MRSSIISSALFASAAFLFATPTSVVAQNQAAPECVKPCLNTAAQQFQCQTYSVNDPTSWVECWCQMSPEGVTAAQACMANSCTWADVPGLKELLKTFGKPDCAVVKAAMSSKLATATPTAAATATTTPALIATTTTDTPTSTAPVQTTPLVIPTAPVVDSSAPVATPPAQATAAAAQTGAANTLASSSSLVVAMAAAAAAAVSGLRAL